jgi:hypothetical protein
VVFFISLTMKQSSTARIDSQQWLSPLDAVTFPLLKLDAVSALPLNGEVHGCPVVA